VPLYIAETSPARFRGRMISVDMIFLGTGSVLACAMDAAFQHVAHSWRYMIGLGAVPSILLGIFLFWCPESPRQLLYHNRRDECVQVVRLIYPNASEQQISDKVSSIEQGVTQAKALEEEVTVRSGLKKPLHYPRQPPCPDSRLRIDVLPTVLRLQHANVLLLNSFRQSWASRTPSQLAPSSLA
jgi:MFS family permease